MPPKIVPASVPPKKSSGKGAGKAVPKGSANKLPKKTDDANLVSARKSLLAAQSVLQQGQTLMTMVQSDPVWAWARQEHFNALELKVNKVKEDLHASQTATMLVMYTNSEVKSEYGDSMNDDLGEFGRMIDPPTQELSAQYKKMMEMQRVNSM